MRLIGKRKLIKLETKNKGNVKLQKAIKSFKIEIEENIWLTQQELESSIVRFDAVHSNGFYIADINIHRAMVAITFVNLKEIEELKRKENFEIKAKELGEVNLLWVGTHDDYQRIFKDNKSTIEKWLRSHGHIY